MKLSICVENFLLKSKARREIFLDVVTDGFQKRWHLIPKYRKKLNVSLKERLMGLSGRRGQGRKQVT